MQQELYPALRNSSRGSSTLVPDTLKNMAIFTVAALAAILFASHNIETLSYRR